MEEERIQAVKTWPAPKSIRDIQVLLGFANFYRRFIQRFRKIATPLTSMVKTTTFFPTDAVRTSKAPDNSNFLTPEA